MHLISKYVPVYLFHLPVSSGEKVSNYLIMHLNTWLLNKKLKVNKLVKVFITKGKKFVHSSQVHKTELISEELVFGDYTI